MKRLTVKEILEMSSEELQEMMTEEEFNRMKSLNIEYVWQLLDLLIESAKLSEQDENEEHISISEYLDYLENMEINGNNI